MGWTKLSSIILFAVALIPLLQTNEWKKMVTAKGLKVNKFVVAVSIKYWRGRE